MSVSENWGVIRRIPGGFEARLQRSLTHDRTRVWDMLTRSELLSQWLAPGSVEPRVGGRAYIDFAASGSTIDSTVRVFSPMSALEYSWSSGNEPTRPVRWSLADAGEGTELELTLHLPESENPARACAGWDAHLEMLMAALEGISIAFPAQRYKQARGAFAALAAA